MQANEPIVDTNPAPSIVEVKEPPPKSPRTEFGNFDANFLVRDLGLLMSINSYPVTERDGVQRAYINFRPYQHINMFTHLLV